MKMLCKAGSLLRGSAMLQAQKAAAHAHGNGGGAPCCIAPGGMPARRSSSDDVVRLSAAEAGTPARLQQVPLGNAPLWRQAVTALARQGRAWQCRAEYSAASWLDSLAGAVTLD